MSLPIFNGDGQRVTFYLYTPSDGAGYAFLGLFGIATITHFGLTIRYRSWHFIALIIGVETFGYYGRAWSHSDPKTINPWVLQSMLLAVAPVFIAATVYLTTYRLIIALQAEKHAIVRPRALAKLYITLDILAFLSQIAGIGLQATGSAKTMDIGRKIITAGLAFQFVMLVFFGIMSAILQRRLSREDNAKNYSSVAGNGLRGLRAVQFTIVLIALRSLVRTIEYSQGSRGTIASHEVFLYLFDALPMLTVMAMLAVVHPGRTLRCIEKAQKPVDQSLAKEQEEGTVQVREKSVTNPHLPPLEQHLNAFRRSFEH